MQGIEKDILAHFQKSISWQNRKMQESDVIVDICGGATLQRLDEEIKHFIDWEESAGRFIRELTAMLAEKW